MEVERESKTGKRLEFLASALKRYNIYQLAEVAGLKVSIKITPNSNTK